MWLQGILSQLQEVFSRRPGVFRRLQGALSRLKWKSLNSLINHFVTKEIIFDLELGTWQRDKKNRNRGRNELKRSKDSSGKKYFNSLQKGTFKIIPGQHLKFLVQLNAC